MSGDFIPMKLHDRIIDHVMKTMEYCGSERKAAARLLDIDMERLDKLIEDSQC